MLERSTFVDVLKADVAEAVNLFFAPVTAVVREFNRAVSGGNSSDAAGEGKALPELAVSEPKR